MNKEVAIAGAGFSEFSRNSGRPVSALVAEACLRALRDAGMEAKDIDGIAASVYPGMQGASTFNMVQALGLPDVRWHVEPNGGPAAVGTLLLAADAVKARSCSAALMYKVMVRPRPQTGGEGGRPTGPMRVGGDDQFRAPYGQASPISALAMWPRRHMYLYSTTYEHLGWVAINSRRHAARNERAVYRQPFTMEEYLSSRMISDPYRLLDCDPVIDGAIAFVLTGPQRARDCPKPPIWLAGGRFGVGPMPDWEQWPDFANEAATYVGRTLWQDTGFTPQDMDFAELYDGFSFLTIIWLESLGFCGPGEGGPFIEGGTRTDLDGELPLNTHGGNLSEGRVHGAGHILEAVEQLRGEAGPRQIKKTARIAVVSNGGGNTSGAVVLVRD
jgi:acetyl-CoA acetyltransferase